MPGNTRSKPKKADLLIQGDVKDSVIITGDKNRVVIYQGKEIVIPSAEAVALHRVALKERLEKEANTRWGGISFYIQEEGVTLPIEASPYETGQLGVRTNLQASLNNAQRLLLLGDPGSGKTVALERLAWELSAGNEPFVPVLIRLFLYDGKPLTEWVRVRLQECSFLRLDDEDMLKVFLQEGTARCVFLFDGLNEVAPEHRNILVGELDRWMSAYPRHAVIITSRVQDELWRELRGEMPAMVVQPIRNEQARTYMVAHLGEKGDELFRRLDERLLALTRTPLVLWLIKEAGAAGESLPGNRGELYKRFVQRMLRRDIERQLNTQFSERMKERALSILALHLSQEQRLSCSRREAVDLIATTLEKDASGKLDKAEALVTTCARHGLLAGEDEVWFAPHQTVQEYFTAVALQETVHQEQQLSVTTRLWRNALQTLTRHKTGLDALASDDWWMETLVQLAGLIDDPAWLARALVQTNPWLAWWCVQEGRIVDDVTRAQVENRSYKLLQSPRLADRRRAVQTLVQTHNERVLRPLLKAGADDDLEVSRLALQGLANRGEAARALVEDVLHGNDELLWVPVLGYLRLFPNDQLWAEIPEQMWNKLLTAADRQVSIKAVLLDRTKPNTLRLLKAAADNDLEVSRLALQGLVDRGEVARALVEDVLHGNDELLWEPALRYLRLFPNDQLWAEIPEQMWDKLLTTSDRQLSVKADLLDKTKPITLRLLKATADDDLDTSMFAVQALGNKESAAWIMIVERIQREKILLDETHLRLQKQIEAPIFLSDKHLMLSKLTGMNILTRVESGKITSQYWKPPFGEPEWVTIAAGKFWMGSEGQYDGKPIHEVSLPKYQIACVPVTNAQYALYLQDAKIKPPGQSRGGGAQPGLENHPVNVSWHDALAYCKWLGEKIQKPVTLPSEAEWEKAARGSIGKRSYPWGDDWCKSCCNSKELCLGETTPVGFFLNGASPYGLLDMSGNVWEWTRSVYKQYPYNADDGREDLRSYDDRVLRGGSFDFSLVYAGCSFRFRVDSGDWLKHYGFRVVVPQGLPP